MKQKRLFILLVFLMALASCIREFHDVYLSSDNADLSVEEAQKAFERDAEVLEVRPFTTNSGTRTQKEKPVITPLWGKGEVFTVDNEVYAVVPLNIPLMKIFARKQKDVQVPDDEKYNNTDIRLLIQKKQNNFYLYTIVYVTGDFSYIIKGRKSIKALKLDKLNLFSGKIRYFDLKGQMLWGEVYKDGMKVGKVSPLENSVEYNVGKVQTRGHVETICYFDYVEYETCYHYGYDLGEGYVENGEECVVDYVLEEFCYDEWIYDDDDYDDVCPYCGSLGCNGECLDSGGDGNEGVTLSEDLISVKRKLDVAIKDKVGERKFSIKEGFISGLAFGVTKGTLEEVLYKNIPTEITINKGLTDIQLKLVLSHEYVHIILYEKSRVAGSAEKLKEQDKDLYDYITEKKDAQEAHHEYMGKYPEIMGDILQEAFKGESTEFYNYGKWAGGGVHSDAFRELTKEEQKSIKDYLIENKL